MEANGHGPTGLRLYSNPHGSVRCYHEGCRCPGCEDAKEAQREYDRARYRANPEAAKERNRKRREQRKKVGLTVDPLTPRRAAANRARANEWYHTNRDRAAESVRSYRQTSRGRSVHQTSNMLRRARIRGAAGSCSVEQLQARIDYYGGLCSYCRAAPFEHVDHAIPVARGGSNWPSNLRPACRDCNLRKWTKTAMEFMA